MRVRFADVAVETAVACPGLPAATGEPDIRVTLAAGSHGPWRTVQSWPDTDPAAPPLLEISRTRGAPHAYRLQFPEASFVMSADGTGIAADRDDGAASHLLQHQVLPLALSRRDGIVLHACGVSTRAGVIALTGPSGAGKSTLAAALCARGLPLVADDALVLRWDGGEAPRVWPTASAIRVWPDVLPYLPGAAGLACAHESAKHRLDVAIADAPAPLLTVIVLDDKNADALTCATLPAAAARLDLLSHLFRLDIEDADESRRLFDLVDRLARAVPARRLAYPDGAEGLEAAVDAVLDAAGGS